MSISHRKINTLISEHVSAIEDLSATERQAIEKLCEKIYLIESSMSSSSAQKKIDDIKQEIMRAASRLKES